MLHKALLDSERREYEQQNGAIRTKGEFLNLVMGDAWFSWLRPISQFIVQIDEAMSAKREPATLDQAQELLTEARQLLTPNEHGTTGEQRYFEAIQRDPTIAMMHVQLSKLLDDTASH